LNRIILGTLSGSAHIWDSKNVYRVKTYSYKIGRIYEIENKNVSNIEQVDTGAFVYLIKMLKTTN